MVPTGSQPVAEVVVGREQEVGGGWVFDVTVKRGAAQTEHQVRLAWVDYEYWSHGAAAPERVVKAVVETVLDVQPERVLAGTFDAAAVRLWLRDGGVDERVRERIGDMSNG